MQRVRRLRRSFGPGLLGVTAGMLVTTSRPKGLASRASACTGAECSQHEPALRFGAVADVQFADVDDAWNFRKTQQRRYRGALGALRSAIEDWTRGPRLDFIADLGDMIDQQCESNGDSKRCIGLVLQEWSRAPSHVHHLLGNHELYNFNREELATLIPGVLPWYRSFSAVRGWRVIVLDAYDINVVERGGGRAVEDGLTYLSRYNPNDLRAPRGSVDLAEGLPGLQRRYLPMGGAIGPGQLSWLRAELQDAKTAGEQCILLTHVPFCDGACSHGALLWNYDEVLDVVRSAGPGAVPLVLAGHDHNGGYCHDTDTCTHHITLQSPLNAPEENPTAHSTVEVWSDRIEIKGLGIVPSRILQLKPPAWASASVRARL
eukprot:TRINITY_DN14967_c0_g1_i2.p1 TRINITY_DN14967_c0_g1~~TRINITY_DN14967_c0_g1_i2.p1  ORF type:complete len:375 (+),score=50.42 TRINITY_DN14967_c0_g1_i2:31-1155(+)